MSSFAARSGRVPDARAAVSRCPMYAALIVTAYTGYRLFDMGYASVLNRFRTSPCACTGQCSGEPRR